MSASKSDAAHVARRYAKALMEICDEAKNHAVIGKQLASFAETWSDSPELRQALDSPVLSLEHKRGVLDKLFSRHLFAPTTRNFLLVLLDAERLDLVETISAAFDREMDRAGGRVRATVTSAVPMERADLTRIQTALERLTGKQVTLDAKVDPDLIGGVVTEIGHVVLDGSIRTQLVGLRERLA